MQAIAYIRASTDEQRITLDAQRARLTEWAQANHCQIVAWHVDAGVSGACDITKRPGLSAALAELRDVDALLVTRRDRLARDTLIAGMVERLASKVGSRVIAVDSVGNGDSPEDMLLRGIMDVFAQYERALIQMRTRVALSAKRSRGEKTGGDPPFGYTVSDGLLVPDASEQSAIAAARAMRADGLSLRKIGARLFASGHRPRSGLAWHPQTVKRILDTCPEPQV